MDELKAQLTRIETKLDQLIEALAEEEQEPEQVTELRTMGGEVIRVPTGGDGFLSRKR